LILTQEANHHRFPSLSFWANPGSPARAAVARDGVGQRRISLCMKGSALTAKPLPRPGSPIRTPAIRMNVQSFSCRARTKPAGMPI